MLWVAATGFGVIAASASQPRLIAPALIVVLAVAGAAGLVLLLPGRREAPFRKMGGALLIAILIIFAALLAKLAAGMSAYFWIFSAIAVLAAARVITHPKPVYSALYFVLTVMASAGLFVLMWAEFMAAALVLIYAGAILVTYVFVIMLAAEATPKGTSPMHEQLAEHDAISREPVVASAVGFALLGVLLFVIFDRAEAVNVTPATQPANVAGFVPVGGTQQLGNYLFDKQLVNLELAGLILTVAMVGAIVIARKKVMGGTAFEEPSLGERVQPRTIPVDDNPHVIPIAGTDNPRQKEYPQT